MAKLTIKRNRARVRAMLDDFIKSHVAISDKPARARPKRRENFNAAKPAPAEPRMGSNADLFASRGDGWGALPAIERNPEDWLKVTTHPDGFIHITARHTPDDDEYVPCQPRPCEAPLREPGPDPRLGSAALRAVAVQVRAERLAQAHETRRRLAS